MLPYYFNSLYVQCSQCNTMTVFCPESLEWQNDRTHLNILKIMHVFYNKRSIFVFAEKCPVEDINYLTYSACEGSPFCDCLRVYSKKNIKICHFIVIMCDITDNWHLLKNWNMIMSGF